MQRRFFAFLVFLLTAGGLSAQETSPQKDDAFGERVRAYLLANPEIILEAMEVLAKRDAAEEMTSQIADVGAPLLDETHTVTLGIPDAPFKIIELFDYKCAVCKAGHPVLEAFIADNPDVVVKVQQLPILGPQSDRAARAYHALFEAAGPAAALALHERLFAFDGAISSAVLDSMLTDLGHDPDVVEEAMYSESVTSRINGVKDAALDLGVIGTPVFVTERAVHQGIATPQVLAELLAGLRRE